MLQIRLSLFLLKEPYFPKPSVVPPLLKMVVERIKSMCARGHKGDNRIYCSLVFAVCEFIKHKNWSHWFLNLFRIVECGPNEFIIAWSFDFFTIFSLYVFPGFLFCFFLITLSFNFFLEVIRKIFTLIWMTHSLVDDA